MLISEIIDKAANLIEFKVWWIPQIPMKAFEIPVSSHEEGEKICRVLADYDRFQFENKIKPDYCNMGGIVFRHPVLSEGEWYDFPEDQDERDDLLDELAALARAEGR